MIFDSLRWMRHLIFLEGDDGGGSGGAGSGDDSAAGEGSAESKETTAENADTGDPDDTKEKDESGLQVPGYFAQLPGEKAKSEAYKVLYKYQKLDDLTDALIKAEGDLAVFNGKRALIVPEKGDKEGIEKFKETLGVPKDPKDYKLAAFERINDTHGPLIDAIRKGCQRIMLTPHQAEAVAEMMAAASKNVAIRAMINARDSIKHQTEKVAELYKDVYPANIDRIKAAEEDCARYESFLKETGIAESMNLSPLTAGNPQIIKAVSEYVKKHGGVVTPKGGSLSAGGKPTGKTVTEESADWKNFKAQRGQ